MKNALPPEDKIGADDDYYYYHCYFNYHDHTTTTNGTTIQRDTTTTTTTTTTGCLQTDKLNQLFDIISKNLQFQNSKIQNFKKFKNSSSKTSKLGEIH